MCAGMFLVLLDATVVNVAVPSIIAGLRTTTAGVQWVVDGYTVALASLLLAGGALGDRLGHRHVVAAGLVIFAASSAGCALAPSAGVLVTARAAQGVGAALLLPGSIAAIADAYPDKAAQARALGIWAGVSSLALPAGPLLGGMLVSTLGWRAVFWVNPPVTAICLVGVLMWARASGERPQQRLDPAGLVLGTLSLAAVVYAVIATGTNTTAAIIAGVVAVLAVTALATPSTAPSRRAPATQATSSLRYENSGSLPRFFGSRSQHSPPPRQEHDRSDTCSASGALDAQPPRPGGPPVALPVSRARTRWRRSSR